MDHPVGNGDFNERTACVNDHKKETFSKVHSKVKLFFTIQKKKITTISQNCLSQKMYVVTQSLLH
uniref:Uncharacterized protein n=1 Tax=Lepeophtheirus salmonis TaxID=72036 RepID=A0A0K2TT73_LEPSM